MIQFNQPIKDYKEFIPSTTGTLKYPTKEGGYILRCVKSGIEKSKKGNDCWVMHFDIVEGEFAGAYAKNPMQYWQAVGNEVGQRICGQIAKSFVSSNPGMVSPTIADANNFDETAVVGLLIGAVLKKNEKNWLRIDSLCDINVARNFNVPF